jgi:SAM-dependent methyltransferase
MTAAVSPLPFDPERFRSAAPHYFARTNYSPRLIRKVVAELALTRDDRVMDLGCGPGFLAIALAPFVREVVAIDPNAAMLAAGREAARGHADNISFVEGSSNDLGNRHGCFRLVTMGRSFHWMDRADTLRRLDAIVEPGGAVALFDVDTIKEGAGDWHRAFNAVLERYEGSKAAWRQPEWIGHAAFLIESAFSVIDGLSVTERLSFPAAQLVDRALSRSRTSPEALGTEKAAALAADLRALAAENALDGMLSEILESNVLIARRP